MFKERMTPEELANLTGYSRQTINKWVRKEGWATSPKPGVQGGKARLVHVNEQVREYIRSAERSAEGLSDTFSPPWRCLVGSTPDQAGERDDACRTKTLYLFATAGRDYRFITTLRDPRQQII